jgi:hypothetical protein
MESNETTFYESILEGWKLIQPHFMKNFLRMKGNINTLYEGNAEASLMSSYSEILMVLN